MQAVAYPEAISLVLPLFQATLPGEPGFQATSYPYPSLTPLGRSESREFEAVTLENEFLRAQWAPGLGGRLVSCVDKRTGEELVPVGIASTSQRGAAIELGIAIEFGGIPRPNDLGPVDVAQLDSEEAAGVVLAETAGGTELSWHLWVRLADDTAALDYEIRVVNRSMKSVAMMPTLRLPAGFAIDERWVRDGKVASSRIHPPELGPNSTAHLTARIIPIGRGETATRSSEHFAVCQRDDWTIYPAHADSVTVLIGTPTQTFEAAMDLDPAQPLVISASDSEKSAVVVSDDASLKHQRLKLTIIDCLGSKNPSPEDDQYDVAKMGEMRESVLAAFSTYVGHSVLDGQIHTNFATVKQSKGDAYILIALGPKDMQWLQELRRSAVTRKVPCFVLLPKDLSVEVRETMMADASAIGEVKFVRWTSIRQLSRDCSLLLDKQLW